MGRKLALRPPCNLIDLRGPLFHLNDLCFNNFLDTEKIRLKIVFPFNFFLYVCRT